MNEDEIREEINQALASIPTLMKQIKEKDALIQKLRSAVDVSGKIIADLNLDYENLLFEMEEMASEYGALLKVYNDYVMEFAKLSRSHAMFEADNLSMIKTLQNLLDGTLTLEELKETQERYREDRGTQKQAAEAKANIAKKVKEVEDKVLTPKEQENIGFFSYMLNEVQSVDDFLKKCE